MSWPENVLRDEIRRLKGTVIALQAKLAAKDIEIADLKRQLEEARKDTERLDWLSKERLYPDRMLGWIPSLYPHGWKLFGDSLREGIDAARARLGLRNIPHNFVKGTKKWCRYCDLPEQDNVHHHAARAEGKERE